MNEYTNMLSFLQSKVLTVILLLISLFLLHYNYNSLLNMCIKIYDTAVIE